MPSPDTFSADAELKEIRALVEARRKSRFGKSRLDRYAEEIDQLTAAGASPSEVRLWLRQKRRCVVALSTVTRWLQKHHG